MLEVWTRPALIRAHIVVFPTPISRQAAFTGTARGASWSVIAFAAHSEVVRMKMNAPDLLRRFLKIARFIFSLPSIDVENEKTSVYAAQLSRF